MSAVRAAFTSCVYAVQLKNVYKSSQVYQTIFWTFFIKIASTVQMFIMTLYSNRAVSWIIAVLLD